MAYNNILKGPIPKEPLYTRSIGIRLFQTLKELSNSGKNAFIDVTTHNSLSYKDLFEISVKVAINLKKLGYAGKIIGICSENRLEFFIPVLAALYIGSPVVTFNHGYTPRELLHACELVKPSFIFCSKNICAAFNKVKSANPMVDIQEIWSLEDISKLCCGVTHLYIFQPSEVDPKEQLALLLFSSGTTGLPKAVALTHRNLSFVHRQFFDNDDIFSKGGNNILCIPFYHAYGFHVALASLLRTTTVKFLNKFDPEVFLSAIEKYRVNYLTLVPALMVFFAKHPLVDKYDVLSLEYITSTAASCSKELEMAVLGKLPNVRSIYQGYGMTESTTFVASSTTNGVFKVGSVGTIKAGVQIKIRNPDTNEILGPNQVGEICIKSDSMMKGYYGNPEATQSAFDVDGWFLTGDLGYYDEDNYVYFVDRLKELIKFKGFQVPPAELEGLLINHPKVMDVAVVGYADEAAGELPMAFIVKKPGVEVNAQEIKDFIKGQVSYPKQLHGGVRFIDTIPKNGSGKILRRELRDLLKAERPKSML